MGQYSTSIKNKTIQLDVSKPSKRVEALSDFSLYPGMLLFQNDNGNFWANPVAGIPTLGIFAIENGYTGGTMWTPYDASETKPLVMAIIFRKGDRFITRINSAPSGITYETVLTPDAGGWLKEQAPGEFPIARVDEYDSSPIFPRYTAVRRI